ncbi:hypothetical protein QJ854_gp026 [Moumouvirus goulette]|uniref:Uncharacterized protein n=1 Tax=Moumouvirus goulette TaxID=1247379 RepID=M1PNY7_9VIRU|nr:hypothetical protein QJ854_gp026 [Moumouvirus goulette]AGF85756.1 hypothetical protein glt_00953 [Moumouvirus goulette]
MENIKDFIFVLILISLKILIHYSKILINKFVVIICVINLTLCLVKIKRFWNHSFYKNFYPSLNLVSSIILLFLIFHDIFTLVFFFDKPNILWYIFLIIYLYSNFICYRCLCNETKINNFTISKLIMNIIESFTITLGVFMSLFFVWILSPLSIIVLVIYYIFSIDGTKNVQEKKMTCACGYCEGFFNKRSCNIYSTNNERINAYGVEKSRADLRYRMACNGYSYDEL